MSMDKWLGAKDSAFFVRQAMDAAPYTTSLSRYHKEVRQAHQALFD